MSQKMTLWRGEEKSSVKMSIDRLTVCGNEMNTFDRFIDSNESLKGKGFAKYPYRDSYYMLDGSIIQRGELEAVRSGKIKELRYEFNPNNKIFEKMHLRILQQIKNAHITRIDVAFDIYDVDMSRWKWIDSKGRPQKHYISGNGDMETCYIGGEHSEQRIRIYNKAKEQKEDDIVWWRVEVQLRGEMAKLVTDWKALATINPFEHITPITDGYFPELEIKTRAMLNYLMYYPSGFAELSKNTRSEYKKLLRGLSSWECIDFYRLWKEKIPDMQSEIESWYSFTRTFD